MRADHEALITVEEGAIGGFGALRAASSGQHGVLDRGLKVRTLMLPDVFQDQDKPEVMYAEAGLDAAGVVPRCLPRSARSATRQGLFASPEREAAASQVCSLC